MDKKYRLAALDMDGTLLNNEHRITPFTLDVLESVHRSGGMTALSTGRCLAELTAHFANLPHVRYAIAENGACLYDAFERKILHIISFMPSDVEMLLEASEGFDIVRQGFMNNDSVMQIDDDGQLERTHIAHFTGVFRKTARFVTNLQETWRKEKISVEKINLYFATEADREAYRARIEGLSVLQANSIGLGLELSPLHATKGESLRRLCELVGIPIEQTLAIGDAANDESILRTAGLAIAMGNAEENIKALADAITDDNEHDGAAKALVRYML